MSVCHLRHIAIPHRRTVWALIFFICLFSAPRPLFADTPPLLLEVSSALTSFYGSKFEGKKTANGQRYNSEALTAAHRSLPFGTVVRITSHANGRDAIVRINDRGPGSKRLLLDISKAAARELNMIRAGVTKIHMEVVGDASGRPLIPGTEFYLDMGTASSEARGKAEAERLRAQLKLPAGTNLRLVSEALPGKKMRYFVGIGPFSSFTKAEKAFMDLKKEWPRTRVVCAKTRDVPSTANLALAVPADDLPDSVADYKGKASDAEASKAKSKSSKASKSKKSKKSSSTASRSVDKKEVRASAAKKDNKASASKRNSNATASKRDSKTSAATKDVKATASKRDTKASASKRDSKASASKKDTKNSASKKETKVTASKKSGSGKNVVHNAPRKADKKNAARADSAKSSKKVAATKSNGKRVAATKAAPRQVASKNNSRSARGAPQKSPYTSLAER